MRRLIGLSACISVLAFTGVARAETSDPETAQFMCDLAGDCAEAAPAAAGSQPAPSTGGARTSATRGFSFKRATSEGAATATATTPATTRPAAVGLQQRPAAKPAAGSADLKLTFLPGSAILTEEAKARLVKYAAALNNPKIASRRVRIEGHTDASGSARSNQSLSQRRAQSVADFLIANGVPASRFEVVGYGSSKPLAGMPAESPANRRVMAVLL